MNQDIGKIIEKLRKMVRHQESAAAIGSEAEAQAFAEKIAEMCDRYRLSVAELGEESIKSTIATSDWWPSEENKYKFRRPRWFVSLTAGIAHGHHCVQLSKKGLMHCSFVGLEEDAATCIAMTNILIRAMKECFDNHEFRSLLNRNDYYNGFAIAVYNAYGKRRDAENATSENSQALIKLTDKLIDQATSEYPEEKHRKVQIKDRSSFGIGYHDGEKQDLNAKLIDPISTDRQAKQIAA